MKKVDDTPLGESESGCCERCRQLDKFKVLDKLSEKIRALEKELALIQEERVTVRAPEATDDPEWYA
ncbi:MAG TPA: hypothetical protein EYN66_05195 [Myxococcales bacterium]|nr:hypothetical protein [Myxococcales bacterium]